MNYTKPVLIIGFNRPEEMRKVLAQVSKVRPQRLYIACDGPREGNDVDCTKIEEIRGLINEIDWAEKVYTQFSSENKGCKYGVVSAIDWIFSQESEAIILEDDCVPDESFFTFCEYMLNRYKDTKNVLQIGGTNPLSTKRVSDRYYFSKYNRIWGWATWKDAWEFNDPEIESWPKIKSDKVLFDIFNTKEASQWEEIFDSVYEGKIDTWDYQWFLCKLLRGFTVIPEVNLISNIGFGVNATHTFNEESHLANLKTGKFHCPTEDNNFFYLNRKNDEAWSEIILSGNLNIAARIMGKIKKVVGK